jgi:hypothetical protein
VTSSHCQPCWALQPSMVFWLQTAAPAACKSWCVITPPHRPVPAACCIGPWQHQGVAAANGHHPVCGPVLHGLCWLGPTGVHRAGIQQPGDRQQRARRVSGASEIWAWRSELFDVHGGCLVMGVFVTREHVRHNKSGIAHRSRTRINRLRELPTK